MTNTSPKNWPLSWRIAVLLNISIYNMMENVFAAGLAPLFGSIIENLGCTTTEASHLPSYAMLGLMMANIYALPLCAYIGKRFTILITMSIFLGVVLWSGWATSYKSLVATRFIGGLSSGVIEAMGPLIVTETFYKHQLGRAMVTYISFLASGPVLGPFFAGIIVTHLHSWRWFFWIMAPIIGVNLVCAFFLLPETSFAGEWERNDSSVDDLEQKQKNAPSTGHAEDTNTGPDYELSQSKLQLWKDRCFFLPWKMSDITRPKNSRFGIVSLLIAPFPVLLIPSVLITALLYGLTIACTVIIAILIANILGPPPHLWSPQSIGFLFISSLIGMIIGFPVGGLVADKLTQRQTRRSNGHYNPRSRLPLIILGSLISPIGLIVIGYYLRPDHFSWVGFAVGFGMVSFGLTGSTNIAATYCLDTFQNKAGVIGVLLNVFKNGIGFGVSYATVPWFNKQGPVKLFGTLAGLLWALYLAMVPIYIYHRQLTEFSERIIAKLGG